MSITHFFDKSVTIQRLQVVSGNRRSWISTATIDIHVQNVTDNEELEYFGAYDATHKGWVDAASVVRE